MMIARDPVLEQNDNPSPPLALPAVPAVLAYASPEVNVLPDCIPLDPPPLIWRFLTAMPSATLVLSLFLLLCIISMAIAVPTVMLFILLTPFLIYHFVLRPGFHVLMEHRKPIQIQVFDDALHVEYPLQFEGGLRLLHREIGALRLRKSFWFHLLGVWILELVQIDALRDESHRITIAFMQPDEDTRLNLIARLKQSRYAVYVEAE